MDIFKAAGVDLKKGPDWSSEETMLKEHSGYVCGVDEVGRGPLAGPVVAAAVILDAENIPKGLNDSKKLSEKKREALFDSIYERAIAVSVAEATVEEVDEINILQASLLAMRRAVEGLEVSAGSALVDGNKDPGLNMPTNTLVKGDGRSLSIAAASIIAKVFRDRMMKKLAEKYPDYGWEQNAGYGVPKHMAALKLVGVTPFHRKSFAPIRVILEQKNSPNH
ncbi:ribonuclease HII [Kordiimonas sp. SCSIO 12603]|uniref:ribonuclease HII n=1 Tax=Kordiimonas sp. SCSIO 12603 TaxID=2829596 RepID=UPI002107DD4C|nr:ribonuclease HII [Kordiimonas sp. SCSIO 12603]UTW58149.1 ribonuclease HII [Kordiimonas sp. SCSIO 12603]